MKILLLIFILILNTSIFAFAGNKNYKCYTDHCKYEKNNNIIDFEILSTKKIDINKENFAENNMLWPFIYNNGKVECLKTKTTYLDYSKRSINSTKIEVQIDFNGQKYVFFTGLTYRERDMIDEEENVRKIIKKEYRTPSEKYLENMHDTFTFLNKICNYNFLNNSWQ